MTAARALFAFALLGCTGGQPLHEPDPTLSRMMKQPRVDPLMSSDVFADGASMRLPPPGTLAMGPLESRGRLPDGRYRNDIPLAIDRKLVDAGRRRFETHCAVCHGVLGDGHSGVSESFSLRRPPALTEPRLLELSPGEIYEVIRDGYGLMGSYSSDLAPDERWTVVAYVRALQLARHADTARLPDHVRAELEKEAP